MSYPQVKTITVTSSEQKRRIDNFLMTEFHGVPKSRIYRALRKGEVRVNKKRIKADYRLQLGDQVRIPPIHQAEKSTTIPSYYWQEVITQRILVENQDLIVINKPSGLAVHGGSGVNAGLIEQLRCSRPEANYLELAHRLDKETSGCLLIAKNATTLRSLHQQLREGLMNKIYLCLVKGHWRRSIAKIDQPLYKYVLHSGERRVRVDESGKPSITYVKPVQYFDQATLLEVRLKTGRTHQIRVHTAYVGNPVVGDEKYGSQPFNNKMRQLGCKRLFLHASVLSFITNNGERFTIEAPIDNELSELCQKITS